MGKSWRLIFNFYYRTNKQRIIHILKHDLWLLRLCMKANFCAQCVGMYETIIYDKHVEATDTGSQK